MLHPTLFSSTVEAPPAPVIAEPVAPELLRELLASVDERGQVTVRCRYTSEQGDLIRIWRSTFLICQHTGQRSELVHAEGIPYAPYWMRVPSSTAFEFILVFAPLPSTCNVFDLVEHIPQAGGFHVTSIVRNDQDLYLVDI
jgi:hypothetical protein